jgi:methionyl-tRNA synthetase
MLKKNYYVTTPIYYVNDVPHIGHAYTTLACDVLARFMRLDGYNVKFLTGTDEHGQKVEKSAIAAGMSTQDFTDKVSKHFVDLAKLMGFSHDDFIRTTERRHINAAQSFWNKIKENGHIYLGSYNGWYSIRDEAFYGESELINGKAPTGAEVEWVEEPSYFFDLSKWGEKLLKFYDENPDFIHPSSRKNEVINFVKSGLNDLSISRTSFKWGVPIPGDENHIMYVWLDALTNYISALGYPDLDHEFKDFWPANVHMVGKDILRFHAIYWPAFLMAAGLEPPKRIVAHGWWTVEGQKISKSIGNVIDPVKLVEEFGLDQTRYFLMREVPFGNDGNYARSSMINRINSELANNIGNLSQRTLSMIQKNCQGKIPAFEVSSDEIYNCKLLKSASASIDKIRAHMHKQEFSASLEVILNLANEANSFIDSEAPWNLAKNDIPKMNQVLYILAESIRYIALLLLPFIPGSAGNILDQLAIKLDERSFANLNAEHALRPGNILPAPAPALPRFIEEKSYVS